MELGYSRGCAFKCFASGPTPQVAEKLALGNDLYQGMTSVVPPPLRL
jgi:hypothetical protein